MDFMLYPTFEFIETRGQFFPDVKLPEDFEERIPKFYEQGGKEEVKNYAKIIEKEYLKETLEIKLQWDEEKGLTNISVGPSGGLDLSENGWSNFQEHNLGTKTGIAAGFIAMKYVSELLKT